MQHPHLTYKDTWNDGVTSNGWAYSHYYLEAPAGLGSYAAVTDTFGNIKDSKYAPYGWAEAGDQKQWHWITSKARYGWYNF